MEPGKGNGSGRLCAIQGGKIQCYGAGSFGLGITSLYEDRKGNLWVSAVTGLWRWAPGPPQHYAFPHAEFRSLIEDDKGNLLLAVNEGLKQLVGEKIQNICTSRHRRPLQAPSFLSEQRWKSLDGNGTGSIALASGKS